VRGFKRRDVSVHIGEFMRKLIILIPFMLFAQEAKPPAPTVEQLQARVAQLEQQIEQMQRAIRLELQIRDGALQACREAALRPAEKPKP
jgi:hypothetical protein